MKRQLFTAALISAAAAYSVSMTSHAAEAKLLKQGNGYAIFVGQGSECLQQTIKDIFEKFENNGIFCPEIPTLPDGEPETPELPDVQEPETPVQPDHQEPDADTPAEDDFHSYALQILDLVNAERAKAGLSQLKLDKNVTAAANVRAKEIQQSFSHTRPDGSSFSSALTQQGISFKRNGENIAWGQKSPEQVMNAWMNSDGHRDNILNPNFENIGIGYYQDANGTNYWVQLFTA
ncbi:MAG: CAP domain-containing protein [Eubacteriales bacterium]|nr:CAP domain-containing protein [Eubacteriales bacterium]